MKLTKATQEEIITKCIKRTFGHREEELEHCKTALADELYDRAFGEVELLALKLPKGWLDYRQYIYITCEGYCKTNALTRCMKLSRERVFPCQATGSALFEVKDDHPLWEPAQAIVRIHTDLHENMRKLETDLRQLLGPVTTLAELKSVWPEGEKFFPVETSGGGPLVPHSLTLSINETMGLRPDSGGS